MLENDTFCDHLCVLPTEVLLYIFTYLPGRELTRCRQVCLRWKHIIDSMTSSDALWRRHCKADFSEVYQTARNKSRSGLLWFNIYRSLALWPKLNFARVVRDEFASASNVSDEIKSFKVLKDGVIGVHKRGSIVYYDIETLEVTKRGTITGDYMHYVENDDTIVIMSFHLLLYVIRKFVHNPQYETNVTFSNVKNFTVINQRIYYINLNNEIYVCDLEDGDLSSRFIALSEESIMCFGHKDAVAYILTFQRTIYKISNNGIALVSCLDDYSNLLQHLHQYNFLERLDWRIFFQWMCILRRNVPVGPLQDIITVCVYGDTVFVGCNWGVLRIYHKPYIDGELDFYGCEPVKQYNFMERSDCPVLTMCPIIQVDVMETEDGHTVLVGMPKKIAMINFVHSFKRTASVAMLPYSDVQRIKVLKIDECV